MKILHIVPTYLPAYRYGGPIYSVHELNKGVVRNGAKVTVYTTNIDGPSNMPVKKEIIDGVEVNYFEGGKLRSWFYSDSLRREIKMNIKKFDVVHITSVFLSASYFGAKYSKEAGVPYLISPRGSLIPALINKKSWLLKKSYINLIEKNNLKGASAIHFTTKYEEEMYKALNLPLKKSIIIPNGIDNNHNLKINSQDKIQFKNKFMIPNDSKIILSLGRLNWKKGFDSLIPAFAEVIKQNKKVVLVIAGSDNDEPGYKKRIEKLVFNSGILEQVRFAGDIRGEDKKNAFLSSDVFIMPSYSENFGISAVEACGYGVPVILTDTVGIATDVREAKAGLIVKKNVFELTKAMIGLLNESEVCEMLGNNGKMLVGKKYVWGEIAKRWMVEYINLTKG